jgi:hypothetical protein
MAKEESRMRRLFASLFVAAVLLLSSPGARAACGCTLKLFACLNAAVFTGPAGLAVTVKCFSDHRACVKGCTKDDCKKECREAEDKATDVCKDRAKDGKESCKKESNKDKEKSCKDRVKENEDRCKQEADNSKKTCKDECKK